MDINYAKVPVPYMINPVRRYIEHGSPVGDFLTALIQNNLMLAVFKADDKNLPALRDWMLFLHWEAPGECHGSPEKMRAWIKRGGLAGAERAA